MRQRRFPLVCLAILLGVWPLLTAAQDATPGALNDRPLDLAAMALAPNDVPPGFFDDYAEWNIPAAAVSDLVLGGATAPPGLERMYQSFYFSPDEAAAIHAYLFEFASVDEASSSFEIVDHILRPPLPDGSTVGPTHEPGDALGDDASAVTVVTYDTRAKGGPLVDVVATTFRRDRLVAGVAVERYTDLPVPGTAVASQATPSVPDPAQVQLATDLAATVDDRIQAILDGGAPTGIELALSELVLPLDQLVEDPVPVIGGYKTGIDLLRCGICGEENSLLPFADTALGGYARIVFVGPLMDGEPQPPFVSIAVSTFTSPEAALDVLAAIREAPNDRPTPGPVPRGSRTLVADPAIPGASGALAFQAALDAEDPNAPLDSAGVDFVVGNRLVTVDVQGGISAEAALDAAIDLATQQAVCLTDGDPCGSLVPPPALSSGTSATPAA
jgi:hypothetical protein